MFSRTIGTIGSHGRLRKTLKLWVKLNEFPPTKVSINNCRDMDDFAKKVKHKFKTKSPVALYTSLDKEYINPGLKIKQLLTTDLKNNSGENPLLVKIFTTPLAKTIYIRDTDDYGDFIDDYMRLTIKNNEHLNIICRNGKGLVSCENPKTIIIDFDDVQDGEKYEVYKQNRIY